MPEPGFDTPIATWSTLKDRQPAYALAAGVDLVVVRHDDEVAVLYGRCLHRGALMADGRIDGDNLICGVHGWDYRYASGVSAYNNVEALPRFSALVDRDRDAVLVDGEELRAWARQHPQPYRRDEYLGLYADVHGTPDEKPYNHYDPRAGPKRPRRSSATTARVSAMGVAAYRTSVAGTTSSY